MAKFKIGLHESENLKHSHAQIRLNDAEDTDDTAGIVARIVKSSMTRLYADVVRTTNLYCSQGGRKPTKLYLAGGSSIIPFVPEFFKEKLNIDAEYLNPFQVISVSPSVDAETLTNLAHMFSETIGLGLRKIGKCPIEIALVPAEIKRQAAFRSKYPYFYATAASLLVYLGLSFWAFNSQRGVIEDRSAEFQKYVDRKSRVVSDVEEAQSKLSGEEKRYNQAVSLLAVRDNWNDLFNQIQQAAPANMWFTSITVSANPAVKEAVDKNSRSANDVGSNPFLGGFLGRMGGQSDAGQEDGNSSSEGSTKMASELTWVNLQGHVVSNVEGTAQVGLEAINLFIDQLIQPKSMFKLAQKSNPRSIFHESSTPDTNITGFELSLELTSPINVASKKRNRDEE